MGVDDCKHRWQYPSSSTATATRTRRSGRLAGSWLQLAILLVLLLFCSSRPTVEAARDSQTLRIHAVPPAPSSSSSSSSSSKPAPPGQPSLGDGIFSAYLPKGVPVPPSGPSKRHNNIGT